MLLNRNGTVSRLENAGTWPGNCAVFFQQVCFQEPPAPMSNGLQHKFYTGQGRPVQVASLLNRLECDALHCSHGHTGVDYPCCCPRGCRPVRLQSLLSAPHWQGVCLPGPAEVPSKPVRGRNHLAAEHAYSWPFASFDLRIRPLHECPYCHVMCTQCVNY